MKDGVLVALITWHISGTHFLGFLGRPGPLSEEILMAGSLSSPNILVWNAKVANQTLIEIPNLSSGKKFQKKTVLWQVGTFFHVFGRQAKGHEKVLVSKLITFIFATHLLADVLNKKHVIKSLLNSFVCKYMNCGLFSIF